MTKPAQCRLFLTAVCFSLIFQVNANAAQRQSEDDVPGAAPEVIERWRAMRFGMFVHWGPVSLKGTEIGWSRRGPRRGHARGGTGTVPMEEYDNLYTHFDPTEFDADQWVRIAQDAGMKYLVFTAKHHDGFSNFDSALTDYKITSPKSPYGKDICRQIADACHRSGLALGWYYSPRDWYHEDFATQRHDQYLKFYLGQLRELCTNYGQVDILWFDGLDSPRELWGDTPVESFHMLRRLQPGIILNNRGGLPGDYDTPEQRVGGFNRQRPWETCMTICRQWAWKPNDQLKTLQECLQTLIYTAGGDGNLLFNVGPMPDGRIEPRQVERLRQMGAWLKEHGDGIYGTRGGPFKPGRWGASTCKGNKINVFVMQWPAEGPLKLPPIAAAIQSCHCNVPVKLDQDKSGISLNVLPAHRDAIATVIELTVAGDATAIEPVAVPYRSRSLAFGCHASASNVFHDMANYAAEKALDDDPTTRWATDSGTESAVLEIDLGIPKTFSGVMIDEPREFQRIEAFEFQVRDDAGNWSTLLKGTRIGPEWERQFEPVTARHVRLNILEASEGPTLWELQLYESKG